MPHPSGRSLCYPARAARAGWGLTYERIGKSPEGLDLPAILDRIEAEMRGAVPEVQWTMNFCLATIGIHVPKLRNRAIAIGEQVGLCKDYPVSKGCTSVRQTVRTVPQSIGAGALVALCSFAGGCDVGHPQRTVTEKVTDQACMHRVFDDATREGFEQALAKASVPYEIVQPTDGGGGVFVQARGSACDALREVKLVIRGPDFPNGRHIHFDAETQVRFKRWLIAEGIPFETRVRDGAEYVVWRAEDAPRVVEWPSFPRDNPAFQSLPSK